MLSRSVFSAFTVLMLAAPVAGASDFPSLVARVPAGTNSLAVIDADAILASPIAKTNGWEKRFNEGSADRPLYLPPEADKVVVAAQLDLVRGCARTWEVALMGMKEPISMSLVARAEGGYVDEINGVKAAWVPSDAYFIEVDSKTLGLMAPANRQAIARWASLRSAASDTSIVRIPEGGCSTRCQGGPQAIMAIDAADAIQGHRIRARLEESEIAKNVDMESTIQLISSMKGLVLQITFDDKVHAVASIDFGVPVTLKDNVAKSLVLRALENMEFSLPGTENWNCSVSGNSIRMSGELDTDALRRVFSLMEVHTTKFSSLKDEDIEDDSQATMMKSSMAYFHSVDSMLTDLRKRTKSNSAGDAGWVERDAAKIDRLPVLHVDQDLLVFGENVSETLRVISGSRKMSNMQGGSAERGARSSAGFSSYNDGYGYYNYNYTSPQSAELNAQNIRADATLVGSSVKIQGWTLIDNATLEIRKSLTQRYGTEF